MLETPNPQLLINLTKEAMPFGKYKGTLYYKIPVNYLEWMSRQGFPKGKTGMMLNTIYEIKLNGLEFLLETIIKNEKK